MTSASVAGGIEALPALVEHYGLQLGRRGGSTRRRAPAAPVISLISVVLPAPLGPTMPSRSPRMTRRSSLSTIARRRRISTWPWPRPPACRRDRRPEAAMRTAPSAPTCSRRSLRSLDEQVHAAHVALAPRGHAIAHPVFFGGDALGEQRLFGLFLRQDLVAPGLELGEAAVKAARCAAVQPDGAVGQRLEKAAVMADQHDGASAAISVPLPAIRWREGRDGWWARRAAGCRGPAPACGRWQRGGSRRPRGARVLRAAEAQFAQQADAAVRIVGRAETRLHIVQHGGEAREIRLLRQIADAWCRAAASGSPLS